jgi:hypothetical protein
MDPELKERLMAHDEEFKAADTTFERKGLPPDGEYQARVDRFDFKEIQGEYKLLTEMKVLAPAAYHGWEITTWHDLENPERYPSLKKHLDALGILPESLSELEVALNVALDSVVEIAVRTSSRLDAQGNPYRNAYVNHNLDRKDDDVPW